VRSLRSCCPPTARTSLDSLDSAPGRLRPGSWRTRHRQATPVTDSRMGGLYETISSTSSSEPYPTFDGREIPGLAYRPVAEGRVPVVFRSRRAGGAGEAALPALYPVLRPAASGHRGCSPTNIAAQRLRQSYQRLRQRDWVAATCRTGNTPYEARRSNHARWSASREDRRTAASSR